MDIHRFVSIMALVQALIAIIMEINRRPESQSKYRKFVLDLVVRLYKTAPRLL